MKQNVSTTLCYIQLYKIKKRRKCIYVHCKNYEDGSYYFV